MMGLPNESSPGAPAARVLVVDDEPQIRKFIDISLRSQGYAMPDTQLRRVLGREYGKGWQQRFDHFDYNPVAAASIGQVHRALTQDGHDLAIKIQYPGVVESIDSDVDNVAALLRLSGLLPKALDLKPLLRDAKRQLHDEADYLREAGYLSRYGELLADTPDYALPQLHAELTTARVLAMTRVGGVPIETLVNAPQAERDQRGQCGSDERGERLKTTEQVDDDRDADDVGRQRPGEQRRRRQRDAHRGAGLRPG